MKIINLEIQNYIIIEKLNIDFDNKHNTIIGQSGSGKSLIVEAISFLFYGKNKEIRKIESDALVKAVIDVEGYDEFLTFTRKVRNGKTLLYVNDSIMSQNEFEIKFLKNIDFSMQGSNTKIKESGYLNLLIDHYLEKDEEYNSAMEEYDKVYIEYKRYIDELEQVLAEPALNESQIIELIKENEQIEKFLLSDPQYNELTESQKSNRILVKSAVKSQENLMLVSQSDVLSQIQNIEAMINNITPEDEEIISSIKNLRYELETYQFNLQSKIEGLDVEEFEKNESILYYNQEFRSKYKTHAAIIEKITQNNNKIELSNDFEKVVAKAKKKVDSAKDELYAKGELRADTALKKTSKLFTKMFEEADAIGIKHDFKIKSVQVEANKNYSVEFVLTNSSGDKMMQIASGGEISRINLLLTSTFNQVQKLFVWDEIDTGISGEIGFKVGKLINKLARCNQIIIISHLPQVTAFADQIIWVERNHDVIVKHESTRKGKVEMIGLLLSGETRTLAANENANQLVSDAENNE